tara:strand:+ start:591 stop:704 length:114 start_codon:yes stop_codon:yes gene_type:complete
MFTGSEIAGMYKGVFWSFFAALAFVFALGFVLGAWLF